jgi:hypothetical protein
MQGTSLSGWHSDAPEFDSGAFGDVIGVVLHRPPTSVNGTSPEQSWDYQARFEAPKNILKDYSMPLLSPYPIDRQEYRSVHGKSDSKPICLHANK